MSKDTESQHSEASPQHTPGPWLYDFDTVYWQPGGPDGESDDTEIICEVETGLAGDLYLIAAAPDLLAALKSLLVCVDMTENPEVGFIRMTRPMMEKLDGLAAKAEGRQP